MEIRPWTKRVGAVVLLILTITCVRLTADAQTNTGTAVSRRDRHVIADFEKRARDYGKRRDRLNAKLPEMSKQATPEQIEAHKMALQRSVQASREKRKRGEIFSPDASRIIAAIIKEEFKGRDLTELRKTVAAAETKGVPLKVNVPYPEDKELLEMSPALLLVLPKLPDHLRYRFVNRTLMLIDEDCGLIIDFMPNAFT